MANLSEEVSWWLKGKLDKFRSRLKLKSNERLEFLAVMFRLHWVFYPRCLGQQWQVAIVNEDGVPTEVANCCSKCFAPIKRIPVPPPATTFAEAVNK